MTDKVTLSPLKILKTAASTTRGNFLSYLPIFLITLVAVYFANDLLIQTMLEQQPEAKTLDLLTMSSAIIGLLIAPIEVGTMLMGLKAARGQLIKPTDIGLILPHSAKVILLGIVTMGLVQLGFMLLILPGLFLLIVLSMAPMLMCDRQVGMIKALELSAKMLTKHWKSLLVIYCVLAFLIILSFATQGIALIFTLPFYVNVKGLMYHLIFDETLPIAAENELSSGQFEA